MIKSISELSKEEKAIVESLKKSVYEVKCLYAVTADTTPDKIVITGIDVDDSQVVVYHEGPNKVRVDAVYDRAEKTSTHYGYFEE